LAINQEKRGDSELGSLQFQRAWMFDGLYWEEIADMFETRDRAACSLFQLTEGEVNSIWFQILLDMLQKFLEICSKQETGLHVHSFNLQKER
jgi:hypothetical protein